MFIALRQTVLPFSFGWGPGGRAAVEPGELAFEQGPADAVGADGGARKGK